MSAVVLSPGPLRGRVRAPSSKSYTHRALVIGHLSGARFRVDRPLDSDDTARTAAGLAQLGSEVHRGRRSWTLRPGPLVDRPVVDCGESGTTLRFLCSVAARLPTRVRFVGRPRLGSRPMQSLLTALEELGGRVRRGARGFPLEVQGPLHGGRVRLSASESSQFVSSLLLVLPTLDSSSRLELAGRVVSAPYVDATLAALRHHGFRVSPRPRGFVVPGGQRCRGDRFRVPGDASGAAYLWAGAAVTGGIVRVDGIWPEWPQADLAILPLLRRYGADVSVRGSSVTVRGGGRRPFTVDLTDAPDLYPLAGVLAAVAPGTSRLRGAEHVVLKESDRRAETARLARALGARVRSSPHGLEIDGSGSPRPIRLSALSDHRVLMSAAVGALAGGGRSRLAPARAVGKSFPGFWSALRALGAEVAGP